VASSTNVPKPKFDNIKHYLLVAEQVILYSVIVAGLGFYGGTRYSQAQAKHDAQSSRRLSPPLRLKCQKTRGCPFAASNTGPYSGTRSKYPTTYFRARQCSCE
jgi:hypothetical protein